MKRICLAVSVFLFCISLFAKEAEVYPVKMSYNTINLSDKGVKTQTVISDEGYEISVGAKLDDAKLKYYVDMDNLTSKDFLLEKNCIQVFEGNYDTDTWTALNISPSSLVITSGGLSFPDSTPSNVRTEPELSAEDACLIVGGTVLCGLFLLDLCDSDGDVGDYKVIDSKHSRFVTSPSHTIHHDDSYPWLSIWLYNDLSRSYDSSIVNQNQGMLLNSSKVGSDYYSVEFSVDAGTGPDYKLRVTLSQNEFIDFYFMRTDRANIIDPWSDRTYGRHSILTSLTMPYADRIGAYYIYSGEPLGWYMGANFVLDSSEVKTIGTVFNHDFDNVIMEDYAPYPAGYNESMYYKYKFVKTGDSKEWAFNMSTGISLKAFSHTWLLLGCGMDFYDYKWYGDFYYKSRAASENWSDWSKYCEGWLSDDTAYLYFSPLIGFNCIFNHLDIAATFEYVSDKGPRFNAMLGFAF